MEKRKVGKWLVVKNEHGIFILRKIIKDYYFMNYPTYLIMKGKCCNDKKWFSYTMSDTLVELIVPVDEVESSRAGRQEIYSVDISDYETMFIVITDCDVIVTNYVELFGGKDEILKNGLRIDGSQLCCVSNGYIMTYDGRVFTYDGHGDNVIYEIHHFDSIPLFLDGKYWILETFDKMFESQDWLVRRKDARDYRTFMGGYMWRSSNEVRKLLENPENYTILVDENLKFAGVPRKTDIDFYLGLSESRRGKRKIYAINSPEPRDYCDFSTLGKTTLSTKFYNQRRRRIFLGGTFVEFGKKYHNPVYIADKYVYQAEGVFDWSEVVDIVVSGRGVKIGPVGKVAALSFGL